MYDNLGECMNNMIDGDLAIFANGENALEGAFTTYIPYFETPVAFFGRGYQDMLTIVHEAGHFAVFDRLDAVNMPVDFCEVHSQANEWMFIAYLEDELDPEVYELIKLTRLVRGLDTIILATAVDECEEKVYTSVTSDTTEAQLAEIITEALSVYGEDIVEEYRLELYFRYVAAENPVYYLSYALSEVVSLTSFVEAEDDLTAAQRDYLKFVDDSIDTDAIIDGLEEAFDEDTCVDIVDVFSLGTKDDSSDSLDNESVYAPAA